MTLDEWISRFDNEEADKLAQDEQGEIKSMLIELRWWRLLEARLQGELKMAENKMPQVAAMFGKTLGEEFRIKDSHITYVFDDVGLAEYGVVYNNEMLRKLLTGEAEIVEE